MVDTIDYGCALNKDILVQGRLFISENHLSFHSNILGWTTNVRVTCAHLHRLLTRQLILAFENVKRIEKKMTALVIPNAIGITMSDGKVRLSPSAWRVTDISPMSLPPSSHETRSLTS